MTGRRSKRELRRAVEELEADREVTLTDLLLDDDGDGVTADWVEYDDDPDDDDADITAQYTVVMRRERAEREGVEILGPVDGRDDLVQVAPPDS